MAPEQPVWIDGDPLLLDEMLGNLIDNALRYGKPRGRICLTIGVNPPALIVEDDGPGISPGRDSVFEAFYRAPDAKAGGSGLGWRSCARSRTPMAWWKLSSRPEYAGTRLSVVFPARASVRNSPGQERAS